MKFFRRGEKKFNTEANEKKRFKLKKKLNKQINVVLVLSLENQPKLTDFEKRNAFRVFRHLLNQPRKNKAFSL